MKRSKWCNCEGKKHSSGSTFCKKKFFKLKKTSSHFNKRLQTPLEDSDTFGNHFSSPFSYLLQVFASLFSVEKEAEKKDDPKSTCYQETKMWRTWWDQRESRVGRETRKNGRNREKEKYTTTRSIQRRRWGMKTSSQSWLTFTIINQSLSFSSGLLIQSKVFLEGKRLRLLLLMFSKPWDWNEKQQ